MKPAAATVADIQAKLEAIEARHQRRLLDLRPREKGGGR